VILDITPLAKADIVEIYQFSKAEWGDVRARSYADELRRRLKALALGQLPGQSADYVAAGLCRQVSGAHVIWFRRETDRVLILRILHQSRDVGRWLG
jgi:toxin ParE1/3/4